MIGRLSDLWSIDDGTHEGDKAYEQGYGQLILRTAPGNGGSVREASTRAKDEGASATIQKPEPESKCRRREFPSSNRAGNFANWLIV
jgi:hypothetical protein